MIQNADSPQSKRIATPKWAIENRELLHIPADGRPFAVTIRALSPSDGTMKLAWIDIANLLPKPGDIQRRIISSLPPNHSSVAIWVEAGPFRALLGADLEHTGREGEGWMAVLTSHRARQEPQSGLHEVSNGVAPHCCGSGSSLLSPGKRQVRFLDDSHCACRDNSSRFVA